MSSATERSRHDFVQASATEPGLADGCSACLTCAAYRPFPQVTASTHGDSASMSELKRWNDQYGEGGSRHKEHFAYYT